MIGAQNDLLEEALWAAMKTLEESARLSRRRGWPRSFRTAAAVSGGLDRNLPAVGLQEEVGQTLLELSEFRVNRWLHPAASAARPRESSSLSPS